MRRNSVSKKLFIIRSREDDAQKSFAAGNEHMTNPSVLSLVVRGGIMQRLQDLDGDYVRDWVVRVVESQNPLLSPGTKPIYVDDPYGIEPSYGHHFVVVASRDPKDRLESLDVEQWFYVLLAIQYQLRWLYEQRAVGHVAVYADQGDDAGGTHRHPAFDILTSPDVFPSVNEDIEGFNRMYNEKGICLLCDYADVQKNPSRELLSTDRFTSYVPWAPRYPFEFWISPVRHDTSFISMDQKGISDLAMMMRSALGGLCSMKPGISYSIAFHMSPEKKSRKHFHWHIRVYPVTKKMSGLELSYGVYLSDTSPEDAAARLGPLCRKEFARLVGVS